MSNNKITEQQVEDLLFQASRDEHVFWGKELVVSYKLKSGFTVTGRAACVDPANFDLNAGRKIAYEDAKRQLWGFEGYRLQCDLAKDKKG